MSLSDASIDPVSTAKAVFICSAGHSGSTLLDLLLGSHSVAASLGEITQLPKNLALNSGCSCGQRVRKCEAWRPILVALAADSRFRGIHENPYVLYLGLFEASTVVDANHQTLLRRCYRKVVYSAAFLHWAWNLRMLRCGTAPLLRGARNKWRLFQEVCQTWSRDLVIDSSKHYLEAVALYRAEPKRTKVLLLVRDGRAVFYSALKRGNSRRRALNTWRRTYLRALPVLSRQVPPADLLRVRYEDLATNPARELHRICSFIGMEYDSEMLNFRSQIHHIVNGNDMRFAKAGAITLDEAWKTKLSAADLEYFEIHAGGLNRQLGY
jgi:hypothetical protein